MKFARLSLACAGLLAALASAPAVSQDFLPEPMRYDGLTVINGGVGEEADAIKRVAGDYRVRIEISGRGGAYYVADSLTITQGDNVVATIPDAGPWLLMDLPAGQYTLRGNFDGTPVTRNISVPARGTTVHWVVPSFLN